MDPWDPSYLEKAEAFPEAFGLDSQSLMGDRLNLDLEARHHVAVDLANSGFRERHNVSNLPHGETFIVIHDDD